MHHQEIRNAWACAILGIRIDVRMILLSEGEAPPPLPPPQVICSLSKNNYGKQKAVDTTKCASGLQKGNPRSKSLFRTANVLTGSRERGRLK